MTYLLRSLRSEPLRLASMADAGFFRVKDVSFSVEKLINYYHIYIIYFKEFILLLVTGHFDFIKMSDL